MGGGAMRAAAKLTGITVATGGLRGITAEHFPVSSASRSATVRPAAAKVSTVEEVKLVSLQSQNSSSGIDDWVLAGGEEEVMSNARDREPLPRVVFGGAPSLQEAKEATSELTVALEKVYLSPDNSVGYGNSLMANHGSGLSLSNSQFEDTKACVISEVAMAPAVASTAFKAFRFLRESSAAQNVVASIASDPNVWSAVLQNHEFQEFLQSQKTGSVCSDTFTDTDLDDQLPIKSIADEYNKGAEHEGGAGFLDFVQKIRVTVVDMLNSLSGYFRDLFGGQGAKVFSKTDGTPRLSAENVMEASFMGLAVMAIMVILLKRG